MTWPYEDHFINTTKYNSQSLNFTIEHEFSRMLRINLARPSHNQIVLVILGVLASLAVREAKPNSRSVHRRVRRRAVPHSAACRERHRSEAIGSIAPQ